MIFVILLNISPGFAEATSKIPVLKNIAKVFTVTEYMERSNNELVKVKMPAIDNTGNSELEKRINEQIKTKTQNLIEESKKVASEFKQEIVEHLEVNIDFQPMEITIDYSVKHSDNYYLSFVISKSESFYSFFEERYYYNIDLRTGKEITLADIYGENYQKILTQEINRQMKEKVQNENAIFFLEEDKLLEHVERFDGI